MTFGLPLFDYAQNKAANNMLALPARNTNGKTWCGPYALAAVCGEDYEFTQARLNFIRGKPVTGMGCELLKAYLKARKVRFKSYDFKQIAKFVSFREKYGERYSATVGTWVSPTLTQWVKKHDKGLWIVGTTTHYQLIQDGNFADNGQTEWTPHAKMKRAKRSRVDEAHRIFL